MFFVIIELFLPDGKEYSYAKAFHILDLRTLHDRRNPFEVFVTSVFRVLNPVFLPRTFLVSAFPLEPHILSPVSC
jgi:hypothetical protein